MIQLALNPNVVLGVLVALAVITPIVSLTALKLRPATVPRRFAYVIAASGPFALGYWFFHNLILSQVGFDSIYAAGIVLGVAMIAGLAAGFWAAGENRPRKAPKSD